MPRSDTSPSIRGVFVTGTDFGVGKTLVAGALAAELARRGHVVAVMKPVEVGCSLRPDAPLEIDGMPGQLDDVQRRALERLSEVLGPPPASNVAHAAPDALEPADALLLRRLCGRDLSLDLVNPYRYAPRVAPSTAARVAERPIDLSRIVTCFEQLAADADVVVVEGPGGLLVPLGPDVLSIDLINRLGLPTLLVAPSRLGAINHCLLSIEALRRRDLNLCGIVLNRLTDTPPRPEEASNPDQIEAFAGPVVRGMLPYLPADKRTDAAYLARRLHLHVDLEPIIAAATTCRCRTG